MPATATEVADTIEAAGYRRPTAAEAEAAAAWLTEVGITHPAEIELGAQLFPFPAEAGCALAAYSWAAQDRLPGLKAETPWPPLWTFQRFGRARADVAKAAA